MKIKLAILENDINYLNRIVTIFTSKYSDKFQIFSFTNQEIAMSEVEKEKIDVFIASDYFEIETDKLPHRCAFSYFVSNSDVDTINDSIAIFKFQKIDLIYKQILSIYSENAGRLAGFKHFDEMCKVTVFSSPCGGVGTSTLAAAYAVKLAGKGEKTFYLSFENFGDIGVFFNGEGQYGMSDVIFALKSKKSNLSLKIESFVKQDARGVYFFSNVINSLDMIEFTLEEKLLLIDLLRTSGHYNNIVIDMGVFGLNACCNEIYNKAQTIVMTSDGTQTANAKVKNAFNSIVTLDQNLDAPLSNRFVLIYNKFGSKTGVVIENTELHSIGGAPIFSNATVNQIVGELASGNVFNELD